MPLIFFHVTLNCTTAGLYILAHLLLPPDRWGARCHCSPVGTPSQLGTAAFTATVQLCVMLHTLYDTQTCTKYKHVCDKYIYEKCFKNMNSDVISCLRPTEMIPFNNILFKWGQWKTYLSLFHDFPLFPPLSFRRRGALLWRPWCCECSAAV